MAGRPEPDENAGRLARVAELRYIEGLTRGEIVEILSAGRSVAYDLSSINHWLDQAIELGVVSFDIDPSFAIVGRWDEKTSNKLASRYLLDEARVIAVNSGAYKDPAGRDLHLALANQTGIRIGELLTSRTGLLVAGGRTVVQIARKISRRPTGKRFIRIDPLSGRNWTGSWQVDGEDDLERPLDADDAALILSAAFPKSETRFSQIGYPLYAETEERALAIMRDHCAFLPDGGWNWDIPKRQSKRAICGVGALHPNSRHRIMRFLEIYLAGLGFLRQGDLGKLVASGALQKVKLPISRDKTAPYLGRIAVELVDALNFASKWRLGYFGDVANRLFPCLPFPSGLKGQKTPSLNAYEELAAKLEVLNRRAVVMRWAHLRDVASWVTAGGNLKHPAIWSLALAGFIEQQADKPSFDTHTIMGALTTDAQTAKVLIDSLDEFERAPLPVQHWYGNVCRILFRRGTDHGGDKPTSPRRGVKNED